MTFSKLGMDTVTGQLVYLPKAARLQGVYIIGIQGTGKSGLIENLIMQDIDQQIGVCVLDPHGELIQHVLARLEPKHEKDVILLDITDEDYPFGFNLFTCARPTSAKAVQEVVDQVMHIFEKLGVSQDTPLILEYLYHCTSTLIANPGYTMAEIPLLLQDEQFRRMLIAQVTDSDVLGFWQQHEQKKPSDQYTDIASTLRRVRQFLQPISRLIVGQATSTIDLQQIMQEGKILLVKLSARLPSVTSLIGSVLIALLLNAAYNRPAQRRQFHLYADEFQRFATEDFATLLEEARKFGIATTIAHQNRSQLDAENKQLETNLKDRSRSVGNLVVFKINSKDADDLAGEFDCSPPPPQPEEVGIEEVRTPVKDVVHHLLSGGSHPHPMVNRFAMMLQKLEPLQQPYMGPNNYMSIINSILYHAMVQGDFSTPPPIDLIGHFASVLGAHHYDAILYDRYGPLFGRGSLQTSPSIASAWTSLWQEQTGSYAYEQAAALLHTEAQASMEEWFLDQLREEMFSISAAWISHRAHLLHYVFEKTNLPPRILDELPYMQEKLKEGKEYITTLLPHYQCLGEYDCPTPQALINRYGNALWKKKHPENTWYQLDATKVVWEQYIHDSRNYGSWLENLLPEYLPVQGQESKFYRQADLDQVVAHAVKLEKEIFLDLVTICKATMCALHKEPIETGSGQWVKKLRPGTVRPYQDVKNDIANQLSGLPPFTARVKIATHTPQNPGKNCLSCGKQNRSGALYCGGCGTKLPAANEYTITTIKPTGGIGTHQLQQRIARIHARNVQDGYVRERDKVEKEITKRQTQGSSFPVAHPQIPPQQPPRHARQVPVQGKCQTCGAANPSGAKFCNQCGTKV